MTGAIVPLTPPQGVLSFLQESDYRFPDEMLFRHNEREKRFFDLYRINVVSGRSELLYENQDYVGLLTDSTFRLRLAVRYAANGDAECFEHRENDWIPFTTTPITDIDSTNLIDFSDDGNTLYMIDVRGRDKAALVSFDMTTRQTRLLAEDDEAISSPSISNPEADDHLPRWPSRIVYAGTSSSHPLRWNFRCSLATVLAIRNWSAAAATIA
jgi:hypothetical protein